MMNWNVKRKTLRRMSLCLMPLFSSLVGFAAEPDYVSDFTLLDHQGKAHQLSWYGDQTAVILFIQGNGDSVVRDSAVAFNKLRSEYQAQNVAFFMLNPNVGDSREQIVEEAGQHNYDLPILVDETQLVAENLKVTRASESFLIDAKTRRIAYRGPVDIGSGTDATLRSSLDALLAGKTQTDRVAMLEGNKIEFPSRDLHAQTGLSYSKDIVPILQNNCLDCHHEGGIGPWAMSNHAMIQGWSTMMQEVVMTRRMPPAQIDPHASKPLRAKGMLSVEEKQKLVHWIGAGARMDAGIADPLSEMTFENPKFTLGEPDLVFKVPAQTIPATGILDYRYIPVTLNLDRDVWVRAMETIPGDRQVLHHVIAYLSSPADKSVKGRQNGSARGESIGGYAPGRATEIFRDNSGRFVKKGSNLLLQMHYTTSGKVSVDETEIGLYLYDKPPAYVMSGGVAGQRRFLIPPNVKDYKIEGEQLIERDAYLYSMMPHMHFRGKYMNYTAVFPNGKSETLLSVPKYNFNWQFNYELAEPLFLPAGTRLIARGAMDNSDRNSFNPDPSMPVRFGLQTKHEMFFGFMTLRYVGDTPENLVGDKAISAKDEVAGL